MTWAAGPSCAPRWSSGLANTGRLLAELKAGRVHYDFVEVMACPGGCAGGGGQPIHTDDVERAAQRGRVLYNIDRIQTVRFSHENPEVNALYRTSWASPAASAPRRCCTPTTPPGRCPHRNNRRNGKAPPQAGAPRLRRHFLPRTG